MNKIISVAYVILQSAFLACCNGCNQSPAPSYHEAPVREAPKEVLVDTVSEVKQVNEEKKDAPVSPASSSVSTSRSTSSSYGSTSSCLDFEINFFLIWFYIVLQVQGEGA